MKTFENFLVNKALDSGMARIGIHLLALVEGKEGLVRAFRGIQRELVKYHIL